MGDEIAAIWPNYNSMHIINTVKHSLKSIENENGNNTKIHLIIIDNASSDGSFEAIRHFVEKELTLSYTIIKTRDNLGYAGAIRLGYERVGKDFDYVLLLNNDIIIRQGSVRELIKIMRSYNLAASQGIILRGNNVIDNFGYLTDELLFDHPIRFIPKWSDKVIYVTYSTGSFTLIDNYLLKQCIDEKPIMYELFPAYLDDNLLGMRLWNCGFTVGAAKLIAGYHLHSATYSRYPLLKIYNRVLSFSAKTEIVKTRLQQLTRIFLLKFIIRNLVKEKVASYRALPTLIDAVMRGRIYGHYLRSQGVQLSVYKSPYVPINSRDILVRLLGTKIGIDDNRIRSVLRAALRWFGGAGYSLPT